MPPISSFRRTNCGRSAANPGCRSFRSGGGMSATVNQRIDLSPKRLLGTAEFLLGIRWTSRTRESMMAAMVTRDAVVESDEIASLVEPTFEGFSDDGRAHREIR